MVTKRAVIYARVAMGERADSRLLSQLTACRKLAREKGLGVVHEFCEVGSGQNLDRPKLRQMRRLVAEGSIEAVIVYELNRLSRNLVQLLQLQAEFGHHGAKLHLVVGESPRAKSLLAIIERNGT